MIKVILACLWVLTLSYPASADEPKKSNPNQVAMVNGKAITLKMLSNALEDRLPATGHRSLSEKRIAEIRAEELDKLIIQELLRQEAERLGIKVEPKELEREYSKIAARFPTEKQFDEALVRRGMTPDDIREGLVRHLLIQKVTEQEVYSKISLTDDQLREYYDGHREQFVVPEVIRLRQILIRVDPGGSEQDWEEARMKAQGISDRIRAGEDPAALAAQFSEDDETRDKGGDTGLLHRGRLPYSEIEEAAFSIGVGGVSDPVQVLQGYVVFRVDEKRPSKQLNFEELDRNLLQREMRSSAAKKQLTEWIEGLKGKADIKTY